MFLVDFFFGGLFFGVLGVFLGRILGPVLRGFRDNSLGRALGVVL